MDIPRPRIVILCDGTWCGRESGTRTNIYLLTQILGLNLDDPNTTTPQTRSSNPLTPPDQQIHIRYNHGVGLGSTFLDYLSNGITALDLAQEVQSIYRYIVDRYTPRHEIWLFGISRGAHTVRCVAGLINNCGILRRKNLDCDDQGDDNEDTSLLTREAYRLYHSTNPLHNPHSA